MGINKVKVFKLGEGSALFKKDFSSEVERLVNDNVSLTINEEMFLLKDLSIEKILDSYYLLLKY